MKNRKEQNMRRGDMRQISIYHILVFCLFFLFPLSVSHAMTPESSLAREDTVGTGKKIIITKKIMPDSFMGTSDNVIEDSLETLRPFWEKLGRSSQNIVRIVHIGDSHVRGHIFPYTVRLSLEKDFGSDAVENIPVTYKTSGLARETGKNGIIYHIIGVNGITCREFALSKYMEQVISLKPDLVIFSFGTNEANGMGGLISEHEAAIDYMVTSLKKKCPGICLLLTTPPGAYCKSGSRRKKIPNKRTVSVVNAELEYADKHELAVWNLYKIAGGVKHACHNWNKANMYQRDKIHFTREGYVLQGKLLYEALIKEYDRYVENGLEQTH